VLTAFEGQTSLTHDPRPASISSDCHTHVPSTNFSIILPPPSWPNKRFHHQNGYAIS